MTDRELMQQALEALERYSGVDQRACDVEEALRERLSQPEQEPFCYHDGRNIVGKEFADHSDVFPLYTSSNPEQQKPVRFNCTVIDDANPNGVPLSQWEWQSEQAARPCKVGGLCVPTQTGPCACKELPPPIGPVVEQPQMQPCAGRNCGSTNPNLHSAECFEDYEKATGMNQWQGLTDDERNNLWRNVVGWGDPSHDDEELMKTIEAKLKEKNQCK